MEVACSASLLGYHFLNHSSLLDFLLRKEKGMCKINVSRPLVSTRRMGCKVHLCHSPSSLWRWKIFFSFYWFAGKPVYFAIYQQFWGVLLFLLFLSPCDVTLQTDNIVFDTLWGKSQWPMGICINKLVCHSSGLCLLPPWGIWPDMIYFLKWPLTVIQSPTWLWICQWHQLQIGSHFQFIVPLQALNGPRSRWTAWCCLVDKFKSDGRPAFKLYCSTEG